MGGDGRPRRGGARWGSGWWRWDIGAGPEVELVPGAEPGLMPLVRTSSPFTPPTLRQGRPVDAEGLQIVVGAVCLGPPGQHVRVAVGVIDVVVGEEQPRHLIEVTPSL